MSTLIVLFNLKDGQSVEDYETFAKDVDVPGVKSLNSIDDFKIYKSQALLFSDDAPPYQYFEVIDVNDMDAFGVDVQDEKVQEIAGKFQGMVDNPLFILTEKIA
ncbi:MAG: REDY-like protein HapK [Candidatus Marinimicrobia bacterium]|nr:REDY-like protein HapK [Candidatus Neomarinimicrobiota bacterium]